MNASSALSSSSNFAVRASMTAPFAPASFGSLSDVTHESHNQTVTEVEQIIHVLNNGRFKNMSHAKFSVAIQNAKLLSARPLPASNMTRISTSRRPSAVSGSATLTPPPMAVAAGGLMTLTLPPESVSAQGSAPPRRASYDRPLPGNPSPPSTPPSERSAQYCFTSIGDFDDPHPAALTAQSSPGVASGGAAGVFGKWDKGDRASDGIFEGLNTYRFAPKSVIYVEVERGKLRNGFLQTFRCAGDTLYEFEVELPNVAFGKLRVGADGHSPIDMQIRTGGGNCAGTQRIIPCDLLEGGGRQGGVTIENGLVDGQSSVFVELFSKVDNEIDFYAQ